MLAAQLSCLQLFATWWTIAYSSPLSLELFRQNIGVGSHSLLQGIFLTQGWNPGLLQYEDSSLSEPPGSWWLPLPIVPSLLVSSIPKKPCVFLLIFAYFCILSILGWIFITPPLTIWHLIISVFAGGTFGNDQVMRTESTWMGLGPL